MNLDEDKLYIKIVDLNKIYNIIVDKLFYWVLYLPKYFIIISHIL